MKLTSPSFLSKVKTGADAKRISTLTNVIFILGTDQLLLQYLKKKESRKSKHIAQQLRVTTSSVI